jgi:hypothetical protein
VLMNSQDSIREVGSGEPSPVSSPLQSPIPPPRVPRFNKLRRILRRHTFWQVVLSGLTLCVLVGQWYLMKEQKNIMAEQARIAATQTELQENMLQIQAEPSIDFSIQPHGMGQASLLLHNRGPYEVLIVAADKEWAWFFSLPYKKKKVKPWGRPQAQVTGDQSFKTLRSNETEQVPIGQTIRDVLKMARNEKESDAFICFHLIFMRSFDRRRDTKRVGVFTSGDDTSTVQLTTPERFLEHQHDGQLRTLAQDAQQQCRSDSKTNPS